MMRNNVNFFWIWILRRLLPSRVDLEILQRIQIAKVYFHFYPWKMAPSFVGEHFIKTDREYAHCKVGDCNKKLSHAKLNLSLENKSQHFGCEATWGSWRLASDRRHCMISISCWNRHWKKKLQEWHLSRARTCRSSKSPEPADDAISQEFTRYSLNGIRGPLLEKLYDALCSAQPTSTQSERNFSLAAAITTKKRSNKIHPEKLNAACFLKNYFKHYVRK